MIRPCSRCRRHVPLSDVPEYQRAKEGVWSSGVIITRTPGASVERSYRFCPECINQVLDFLGPGQRIEEAAHGSSES